VAEAALPGLSPLGVIAVFLIPQVRGVSISDASRRAGRRLPL